jgi:hypothetical protein
MLKFDFIFTDCVGGDVLLQCSSDVLLQCSSDVLLQCSSDVLLQCSRKCLDSPWQSKL